MFHNPGGDVSYWAGDNPSYRLLGPKRTAKKSLIVPTMCKRLVKVAFYFSPPQKYPGVQSWIFHHL